MRFLQHKVGVYTAECKKYFNSTKTGDQTKHKLAVWLLHQADEEEPAWNGRAYFGLAGLNARWPAWSKIS